MKRWIVYVTVCAAVFATQAAHAQLPHYRELLWDEDNRLDLWEDLWNRTGYANYWGFPSINGPWDAHCSWTGFTIENALSNLPTRYAVWQFGGTDSESQLERYAKMQEHRFVWTDGSDPNGESWNAPVGPPNCEPCLGFQYHYAWTTDVECSASGPNTTSQGHALALAAATYRGVGVSTAISAGPGWTYSGDGFPLEGGVYAADVVGPLLGGIVDAATFEGGGSTQGYQMYYANILLDAGCSHYTNLAGLLDPTGGLPDWVSEPTTRLFDTPRLFWCGKPVVLCESASYGCAGRQYQGDGLNSGRSGASGVVPGGTLFSRGSSSVGYGTNDINSSNDLRVPPVVDRFGRMWIVDPSGQLVRVNALTGQDDTVYAVGGTEPLPAVRSAVSVGGGSQATPLLVADDTGEEPADALYFVDVDGVCTKVTAAQEGTASQAWQTLPASGDMPTGAQFAIYEGLGMHARLSSPKVGPDDAIYCGSLAGYLYKWAPDTGGVPSPFPISTNINNSGLSPILAAPATTDSYIYFATYDGRVFRVDPNGSNLISHATGKNIIVGPVIDSQGYVIVTCTDGTIYKLTSSLGTSPVWTANLPQRVGSCTVYAAPALTEGNDIYVGTDTGKVVKLSGSDGSSIATYTGSGVVCGNLLIDSDGYVYWGTSNSNTAGYLYRAPSNLSTASAYSLGLPCRGISMLWDGSIYAALAPHTQGDPILKLVGPADTQLVSPVCRVVLEDHLYVGPDPQPYVWSGHDNYAGTMSNQAVTIEFRPEGASSTTDALYSFVGYLSADNGTMTVPGVPSGTYDMYAKGLHWLRRVAAAVTVAPNMDVVNFGDELNPCLDGDVVDHNRVTTTDLGMILDVYASAKPEFDVPFYTDLNEDGHTSTTDLGIVLSNFGQFGD